MASSGSVTMLSLVTEFMMAIDDDHRGTAFTQLRRHVMHNCQTTSQRSEESRSHGIGGEMMSSFLKRLIEFGENRACFGAQINEMVEKLEEADGMWKLHIAACQLRQGQFVEIVSDGKFGKLVEREGNGSWKVELFDGSMRTVPESHLRCLEGDSAQLLMEADRHVKASHQCLEEFLPMLCVHDGTEGRQSTFNQIRSDYKQMRDCILSEKDLHFVFAGLVSTGKTTLVNSLLAHCIPGQWNGEMLPSAPQENTRAVTMLAFNARHDGKVCVRTEAVHVTSQQDFDINPVSSEPTGNFMKDMKELQEKLPSHLDELTSSADGFQRLIVELPHKLEVVPGHSSEVFVDTPGLDSVGLRDHLVSILAQKCFLYCYLVDVASPAPFGNHGFEMLQLLASNGCDMFPPVIIFTKFKQLEEQSHLPTWKLANRQGLEARLKGLVNSTLEKLEAAKVPCYPFFAEVDGLLASADQDTSPELREDIQEAQEGLSKFCQDLVRLGRNIATARNHCRMLDAQAYTAQQIINEICREDGHRLLQVNDLKDVKTLGEKIKTHFSAKLDQYFKVEWTEAGLVKHAPLLVLLFGESCAILCIKAEFEKEYENYRIQNPDVQEKRQAVEAIVTKTTKTILGLIMIDLSKYEIESLSDLRKGLEATVDSQPDVQKHLQPLWQQVVRHSLGSSAALGGIGGVGGGTWMLLGLGVFQIASATALIGATVGAAGLAAWGAWTFKDDLGAWTWEEAKKASWEAVLEVCEKNCKQMSNYVKNSLNEKIDDMLRQIEDHRIAPNAEASDCEATKLQSLEEEGQKAAANLLEGILKDKKRWLGKKGSRMWKICQEVLEERSGQQIQQE